MEKVSHMEQIWLLLYHIKALIFDFMLQRIKQSKNEKVRKKATINVIRFRKRYMEKIAYEK